MVRIRKILCPVDFFPQSELALSYAASFAKAHRAGLHAIHVVPPVASLVKSPKDRAQTVKSEHEEAQERLAKIANEMKASGVRVTVEVRFGEIDREILNAIGETRANLIVAGTHGRRGFEHWLMGSVCERLLRRVPVPMLTTGRIDSPAAAQDIREILVGIDFSEGSAEAAAWAFSIAHKFKAGVTLVHVTDYVTSDVPERYRHSLLKGIRFELENLVPARASHVATRVEFGIPYQVLLALAEREKAGMIVIGTHGKSMVDRTLLGTTAERVVRGAPCPVLVVPLSPIDG